jgi:hypothetical protein
MALTVVLASASAFTSPQFGFSRSSSSSLSMGKSLVVLSPPGGVGEVAAVKAAIMGGSVKWFVISGADGKGGTAVSFPPETLEEVRAAGGSVELAGADAKSLLDASAIPAFRQWCGGADGIICTMDGVSGTKTKEDDPVTTWQNAIKVAAKEASSNIRGMKLAVLPANEDDDEDAQSSQGMLLSSLFGKKEGDVPVSLASALGKPTKLRHGELFGTPETSVRKSKGAHDAYNVSVLYLSHNFPFFSAKFLSNYWRPKEGCHVDGRIHHA